VACRFDIPERINLPAMRQLAQDNGELVRHSLFDYVAGDLNESETSVGLFPDEHPQVQWWYRNLVGPQHFWIQGYHRNPIYPDVVVQEGEDALPVSPLLVLESKGKHLKGSKDTGYKLSVAGYFNGAGRHVAWQTLGQEFESHRFRFQILDKGDYADRDWRDDLKRLLEDLGNSWARAETGEAERAGARPPEEIAA
jgi:type III restriction enzyme